MRALCCRLLTHNPLTALWNYTTGSAPKKSLAEKVSDLFKPNQKLFEQRQKISWGEKFYGGICGGALSAALLENTGVTTNLHEVVGHGVLGFRTIFNYSNASWAQPSFWVQGWDNFGKIGNAHSFTGGLTAFFNWIIGNPGGNAEGQAGWANRGWPSGETPTGKALGDHGSNAWISLTGVIPGLVLDWVSIAGGMFIRKTHPILSGMLVSFGLVDELQASAYAISAAVMSNKEMHTAASQGHDFANVAVQLSDITGASPHLIADSVASIITVTGPMIALFSYLYTKSSLIESVPDLLALKHWVNKAKTNETDAACLKELCERYSKKKGLKTVEKAVDQKSKNEMVDFLNFLLDNVPSKILTQSKKEILDAKQKGLSPNRLQKVFSGLLFANAFVFTAAKVAGFLYNLGVSSLQTAASVLMGFSIVGEIVSICSAAYQVYRDFCCLDSTIPHSAKLLSVAKLILTIASAVISIIMLCTPGINVIFIAFLFSIAALSLIIGFVRSKIIIKHLALTQATEPETAKVMKRLWERRKESLKSTSLSSRLRTWASLVRSHPQTAPLLN